MIQNCTRMHTSSTRDHTFTLSKAKQTAVKKESAVSERRATLFSQFYFTFFTKLHPNSPDYYFTSSWVDEDDTQRTISPVSRAVVVLEEAEEIHRTMIRPTGMEATDSMIVALTMQGKLRERLSL